MAGQFSLEEQLWLSARDGNLEKAKQVLQKGANFNCRFDIGDGKGRYVVQATPYAVAYINGHKTIVELFENSGASPNYDEILLAAAVRGQVDIVKETLKKNANINGQTLFNWNTALHLASGNDHKETVQLLLLSNADPNICNRDQQTALYLASKGGHFNIVQLLLCSNADPNICDINEQASAHVAAEAGHVDILKLLIEVGQVDVNARDKRGNSLLHLACANSKVDIISYLLHTGKVNPLAHNNNQNTPLEEVQLYDPNRLEILKMFEPFEKSRQDYPIDSYRKVFFCGSVGAGKSSLAQCIIYRADKPPDYHYNSFQCIEGVQLETAGINYHNIRSHEVGDITLYDFAGHQEYYSSHAAVLENLMLRTPAVFIIVIDSTKGFDYFKNWLYYWFNFIENVCSNLTKPSQVIVVGSFADQFTGSYDEFKSHVNHVVKDAIRKQEYRGFVAMECHRPGGKGFPEFIVHLRESCKAVLNKSDNISYYCHVYYAYLQKLQKVAISLNELIESLKDLNDPSLLSDETVLVNYLSILSDKGLILFLRNKLVSNSWIVVNKSSLLAEVNGVLFNQNIKHLPILTSSNTGIVHVSVLQALFPIYDTSMLIDFLISMEFCHVIDSDTLDVISTNLSSLDHVYNVDVLFFPALLTAEPPLDLNDHIKSGFGWCLYCPSPFQFLSVRFLHVLLLRLVYLFCLPHHHKTITLDRNSPTQQWNRHCTVWKNGIYWKHGNDVVVEVTDHNRCVTVFVSNISGVESQKICCSVIKLVLSLQKQFCPCKFNEYIIPSGSLADIRNMAIVERILYSINDVARRMLVNEEIFDCNEVQASPINVKHICPHEPYIFLAPAVIHALFSNSKANEVIPEKFLQHIQEFAPSIMSSHITSNTYSNVASHLNNYSFFTGRNPLVLSSHPLTLDENIKVSKDRLQSKNISSLKAKCPKKNELLQLMSGIASKWYIIGEVLGIKYTYLASLQNKISRDIDKLAEVLQLWMDTMPKPVTWNTILQVMESPLIESKIIVMEMEKFLKSMTKGSSDISDDDLLELLTITDDPEDATLDQRIDHHHLQNAIKKGGVVRAKLSKVLVQGPARVGKTCVKCLVLSQRYDENTVSTGVIERPHIAMRHSEVAVGDFSAQKFGKNKEKRWELVRDDKNDKIVVLFANYIKSKMKDDQGEENAKSQDANNTNEAQNGSLNFGSTELQEPGHNIEGGDLDQHVSTPGENTDKIDDGAVKEFHNDSLNDRSTKSQEPDHNISRPSANTDQDDAVVKELSKILNEASNRDEKLTLCEEWLYFIDSGGQIQFQQILQAFIPYTSILMLVISLADNLSAQSSCEFRCEGGRNYKVSEHSISIETLLRRLISMVSLNKQQLAFTSGNNSLPKPADKSPSKVHVMTIATHRDEYDQLKKEGKNIESIEDKYTRLNQIFQGIADNLLCQNAGLNIIPYEVDGRNASKGDFEDDVIKEIRDKLSTNAFEVDIPLFWYGYEILLRHKACNSCGILTLEECKSFGKDLILEDEIESALNYLHVINSILYYPEVTDLVFIDPYSLIQVVNELMVLLCKVRSGDSVSGGLLTLQEMSKHGVISSEGLSQVKLRKFTEISNIYPIFKRDLMNVFVHLLIAAKLPNGKYFMPALLPLIDPLAATFLSFGSTPLLFYFKNGAPVGFFCAMIANLLSSEDYITDHDDDGLYNDFSWELDTKFTPKMYSNAIILCNNDLLGRVCLVESSDWFEIHCECREDQAEVKEAIENAIKETKKRRNIGREMKLDIAFYCPCGKQPRHLANLKQQCFELQCNLPDGDCVKISPQMSWISSLKSNPSKRPELRHLVELLAPISSKWELLGTQLGVEENFIEGLRNCEKASINKLTEVLQKWIDTKPTPVTWKKIIQVVKGPVVQKVDVATTIQESLKHIRIEQRKVKRQRNKDRVCAKEAELINEDMSDIPQLYYKPDKLEVLTKLVCIDASWRGIGLDLGVSNNDLDGLAESNKSNQTKLDYVLQKWIEMDGQCTPVTWKVIVDVVKGPLVQNKAVAMEIYKSLKHQDAKQQNTPELKVNEAFLFLEEHKFKSSEWCTLARALDIPFKERRKLTASYKESKNHDWVLEETLDYWITHHPNQPSLEELTRAVEKCDTIRSSQDSQEVHDSLKKDSSKKRKLQEENLEQLEVSKEESSKKRMLQEERSNFIRYVNGVSFLFIAVVIGTIFGIVNVKEDIPTNNLDIHERIIGGYPYSLQWGDSSFLMNISADSFPKGQQVDIFLSVEYYHHLEVPKGYKLLSPTYNIIANERLQKAVTITLKHNAVVTRQEVAESLAVLHYSHEGEMKILRGKAEINSTFITFQMSELCHIAVIYIGSDYINQTYNIVFYRQQPNSEAIDPCFKIRAIIFPNNIPIGEIKEMNNGWKPNDNASLTEEIIIGSENIILKVEPAGCWNICENNCVNNVTLKNEPVPVHFIMKWKTSDCDGYGSYVIFRNSYNNHTYMTFSNDVVIPRKQHFVWKMTQDYAAPVAVASFLLILLALLLWILWLIEAINALTGLIVLMFVIFLLVGLNYFGYMPVADKVIQTIPLLNKFIGK